MRVANARQSIALMEYEMPFRNSTGTMSADTAFDDEGYTYIVKSYGVDVGRVRHEQITKPDGTKEWTKSVWITEQKYSVTTSKHTTYARRALTI